ELVRRTQTMFDAVTSGDKTPWNNYVADDVIYFDEKGHLFDKKSLVADVSPLPTGYSGSIKVKNVKSHIEGPIAIMSYDSDETETIYGQELHARYHTTDTWMNRNGEWKIVAGQVLRYYEDPAQGALDTSKFKDYTGSYELAPGMTLSVSADGNNLYMERSGRPKDLLLPESSDLFFRKGVEGRILFHRDVHGTVDALYSRRNNEDVVWKKK
ncbi:MAG TPA: DUF4440 domain-containing protein, partial [Terriglobales bacterium]|nr:DUF4440 domain-containing protein [Terriglobales bacterium]